MHVRKQTSQAHALEVGLSPEHTRALANEEAQAYLQDVQSLRATHLEARRRLLLAAAVPGRNGRLRVAYLSGTGFQSFTTTAHFIVGVLEAHRPETVDASCYAFLPDDGSEIRRRIGRACGMHEAAAWSHAEVAARLNDAMVHVLVDLTGLTLGPRLHLLAAHPTPVQVHWHGYPGTLGSAASGPQADGRQGG